MKKEFVFENVRTGNYNYTYLIGIPVFFVSFLSYSEYRAKYFGLWGIILTFIVILGAIYFF